MNGIEPVELTMVARKPVHAAPTDEAAGAFAQLAAVRSKPDFVPTGVQHAAIEALERKPDGADGVEPAEEQGASVLAAVARKPVYAGIPSDVLRGIRNAASATGIQFDYLVAQAGIESGFDTTAKAATSTARGLYQFIEQTWLSVFKDNGEKYGVGALADKISRDGSGRMRVTDRAARREILALRDDPALAAAMGAEYAADNKAYLEERLGRQVGSTELYMAHFLGPGGAAQFLQTLQRSPHAKAAVMFPDAAHANRPVFYGRSGKPLSVAEVFSQFQSKLSRAGETAVAAIDEQARASARMAMRAGARLVDTVADTASAVGRLFTAPRLSPTTVLALAELPIPGGKGGIGSDPDNR